jgi:peptidoglycan/LPS O-acetylase OafA/YrhL
MTADRHDAGPQARGTGRLVVLDGLRFVAATMVVMYHYVGVPNAKIGLQGKTEALAWGESAAKVFPHPIYQAATFGWTGVELFFMISGFVICMSGWGRKPAAFFISRVVRLVPAYWAATIVTGGVLIAFPRLTAGVHPGEVLTNLTMVQSAYNVPNLDPAYWTLFVELMFYLAFGLVAVWGITYRRMVTFCVVWSVASIVAAASHNEVLNMLASPAYSPYFVAGIACFLIYRFGGNLLLWAILVYSWLIALNLPHTNPPWQVSVTVTAFFVIMSLVATHKLDAIRWRWLTVAGALTYPLYLLHQDIGFTVFSYLRDDIPPLLLVVITFIAILGLAWLIHRVVERPLAPLLRAKLTAAVGTVVASGVRTGSPTASSPGASSPGAQSPKGSAASAPARASAPCATPASRRLSTSRADRLHGGRRLPAPAAAARNEPVRNEPVRNEPVRNEPVRNETVRDEAQVP